jgi:hypothetical protein
VTLLLVAVAMVAWRLRRRVTRRGRAFLIVTAILGFNLVLGGPALAQQDS